jgi:hypothetical protein
LKNSTKQSRKRRNPKDNSTQNSKKKKINLSVVILSVHAMNLKFGLPKFKGQGSTEYLVLLAVVLIIALVSLALLSFFPGTSLDAKAAQSKAYWSSASPIAIVDWGARARSSDGNTLPYLRIKNTGVYPIRITGIIGADGGKATNFYTYSVNPAICPGPEGPYWFPNISDYYYLAPGEEKYFAATYSALGGIPCTYEIVFVKSSSGGYSKSYVGGATSVCENSTTNPGIVEFKTFGFEYIEYVEGKEITKKQIGSAPLMIKCLPPA